MSRFLRVRKGSLEQVVFKTIGVDDFNSPVNHTTIKPHIWTALNNNRADEPRYKYSVKPITRMNHNLLKLPVEVFEEGRQQDLEKIFNAIKQSRETREYLAEHPEESERLNSVVMHAIDLLRIKSPFYWRDSTKQDATYHKAIYIEAQNLPLEMNRHNARTLARFAVKRMAAGQKEFTIMDMGTGGGNTIRFALEEIRKLNSVYLARINVVLNDIELSVNEVSEKIKQEFGVKNVMVIPTTFYVFPQALELKGMFPAWKMAAENDYRRIAFLRGKVDAFTSFASFNNIPHSNLAFQTIFELLRPGGRAFLGDWGGYDITQRKFTQRELNRRIRARGNITVRDNIKGFWWFWLHHHGFTQIGRDSQGRESRQLKWWRKLEKHIDTAKEVDVLDWFNRNHPRLEAERVKRKRKYTFFGYANRAYRTPEMVRKSAKQAGLRELYLGYPAANRTGTEDCQIIFEKHNPRFVTWFGVFEKAV
ncbi:methyltransferase domain-containing protein [Candidatus Micrarchaeota archaeon]|nr:methyltransferase domain-containing protein [Candidatus Micrarchaeota archaeon]